MPDYGGAERLLNRRVRAFSASDRATHAEGVAVAIGSGPTLYFVTETGALESWQANLCEETAPDLPPVKVQRAFDAVHYVTIDTPEEWSILERHPKHGDVTGMRADPAQFPSTAWADAFDRVMEHPDETSCDFTSLTDEATGQCCSNPIGWVLYEDDEEPHRSGMTWRQVTLVWSDEGIAAVCEDCSPPVAFAAAADAARRVREESARLAAQRRVGRTS